MRNLATIQTGGVWPRKVRAGPGIPRKMEEATYLAGVLPEGHFPLQPSCVCLFITLGLTLAAALGGTFFWPEVITSLPSHFVEGETEGHRGALVCQWLSWDPYLVHAGGGKG